MGTDDGKNRMKARLHRLEAMAVEDVAQKTPAERLLDVMGPVERYYDLDEVGDFGNPARMYLQEYLEPYAEAGPGSRLGPLDKIYVFWFAGMSCDGCTIATLGASSPPLESMMLGAQPGLPQVVLHHYALSLESGPHYVATLEKAIRGELDAPYVIVLEGSATDEAVAYASDGGFWAGNAAAPWGLDGEERTVTADEFIARLASRAAAAIGIGTCATWGGIPSAEGNPTGAMSLMDFLGRDYRSAFGLPVVNVPGCPPIGDDFVETVAAILYFLQGFGPLPEFDELGRPAWQFGETVHRHCVRGAYYEEGDFAVEFGDPSCLVKIGCWGPVVNCHITSRGFINHVGGCMNTGGACIGCMMPGFPDKFTPFYKEPPGSGPSAAASMLHGRIFRSLRIHTNAHLNRERRWDIHHETPSGWGRQHPEPGPVRTLSHRLYDMVRQRADRGRSDTPAWGKRSEWTQVQDPMMERHLPGGTEHQPTKEG
jgi:hydrogenase small subunit